MDKEEEEVGESRGARDGADAGSPNGSGVYDPEATYVPGPDDPKLFDDPETELPLVLEPTEPRPSPADWRTKPNPWADVPEGKTLADVLEEAES